MRKKEVVSFFIFFLVGIVIVNAAVPEILNLTLVSLDGSNFTTQDLNCSTIITDPDFGNKMNVTVKWYKNDIINFTLDYNNSYANNTMFSAILKSGNTTKGENWICSIRLCDNNSECSNWTNSSILTILANPKISIIYPQNTIYKINVSELNYTVSNDAQSCWYNLDNGVINSSPQICGTNWSDLSSTEGTNTWIVYANDSYGNENSASITFSKDTIFPVILSGPSVSGITENSATITWTTNESSNSTITISPSATYSDSSSLDTSHSMSLSGLSNSTTYTYSVTSCDAAGNCKNSSSASFTTLTSSTDDTPDDTTPETTQQPTVQTQSNYDIEISGITDLKTFPGTVKKFTINAKNTGKFRLTKCNLEIYSDMTEWFAVDKSENFINKSINSTETEDFDFEFKVQRNAKSGRYFANISINCSQFIKSKEIYINIEREFAEINIKELGIIKGKFFVIYDIKEISGFDSNITIFSWIENETLEFTSLTKNISLKSNETIEMRDEFELPENLREGSLTVFIKAVSEENISYIVSKSLSSEEYRNLLTGAVIGGNSGKTFLLVLISAGIFVVFFLLSKFGKNILKKKHPRGKITSPERRVVEFKIPKKKDFNIP